MKKQLGYTLIISTVSLFSTLGHANAPADKGGKADSKQEAKQDTKNDVKADKTQNKTNFATKEQKDLDKVLGELNRQHTNASAIVKANREPVSLATQSALVAKTSAKTQKDENLLTQLSSVASSTMSKFKQTGVASWYGRQFHGKKTASGERFDMNALTAAHRSLPMNCYVKVTNKDNGQSVVVRINDRGPYHGNRVMDLSYGAAKALGITQKGMGNVIIERIDDPSNATQLAMTEQ